MSDQSSPNLCSLLVDALELVAPGVVIIDANGEVIFRNSHADVYLGSSNTEVFAERALSELLSSALTGAEHSQDLDLAGPPVRNVTVKASPVLRDGVVCGAIAVIEDVTERRRLDAVRRDFVANISHELKTPVGALSLLAETIQVEDDVEIVHRLAARMQIESSRVGQMVEDLLSLARVEAEVAPTRAPVATSSFVAEAADSMRPIAEKAGVSLEVAPIDADWYVLGSARQLASAVQNLIENAVKYSEPQSQITVTVSKDETFGEVSVSDTGVGIPARDLDRVFERFYRVDQARARNTGGTGLGLAIVRHIVSNHGGEVRVASTEGVGSTFTLRLPLLATPDSQHIQLDGEGAEQFNMAR